jgi:multidrug efflux pump subunit AcrA (membrane-fusion protein)
MGGTATIDPEAVRAAKMEIQGIVQEIAALSKSDISADEFYEALLNKVVQALAALGGAVWTMAENGGLRLQYHMNLRQTGMLENPVAQMQHGRLLQHVLKEKEGSLVPPHSGAGESVDGDENAPANPTDFLLVLSPVSNDQGPQGVVEVFQRPGARVATQRGYLRFVEQMCDLAGDYLKAQRLKQFTDKQSLWEQLETFTRTAHQSLDSRQTAFTVANEGRRLIGCDRVSVAINRSGRCKIEAVSGQDLFDKRSNVVTLLGKLADAVTATGEDVWYTGDTSDLAPQVEEALDTYVDESHAKAVAVLPLARPRDEEEARAEGTHHEKPDYFGALIVEQMVDSRPPQGLAHRVDVVRQHSATALANAMEHENIFLMPVWKSLGKTKVLVQARTLPKTIAVLAGIAVVTTWLCFWPADFNLEGRGTLLPTVKRSVYSKVNGIVEEVLVEDGQPVAAGRPLLRLSNIELQTSLAEAQAKIATTRVAIQGDQRALDQPQRPLTERERIELRSRIAVALRELTSLEVQEDLLQQKLAMLEVKSPIAGRVMSWHVKQELQGRTVTPQHQLMTIAQTDGEWEVEILMPEHRMGHITREHNRRQEDGERPLPVTFILATKPDQKFTGEVVQIAETAEVRGEQGNTVKIRVAFEDQEAIRQALAGSDNAFSGIRPGATVTAKVHCGTASIGYVWLHDLVGWVQSKILFRL